MTSVPAKPYRRVTWAFIGAAIALALVGLVWLLATAIKSPQDALASASAPPPSQITVPVEKRTLDMTVRVDGHLASPTRVTGQIPIDARERATHSPRIVLTFGSVTTTGTLTSIAANGDVVLRPARPLPTTGGAREGHVVFTSGQAAVPSLVVPISALFTSASGTTSVVVIHQGVQQEVPVHMGANVGGFVAVQPTTAATLAPGDNVLVSEPTP